MKLSDVVGGAGLALYAEVALLIFLAVFIVVGLRVLLSRRSSIEHDAHIPFDDEKPPTSSAQKRAE